MQERPGRRVERAADDGAFRTVQEERVVHDPDAALHVVEGVAGERAPGGRRGEVTDPGPGVQRDRAVPEFGDGLVERGVVGDEPHEDLGAVWRKRPWFPPSPVLNAPALRAVWTVDRISDRLNPKKYGSNTSGSNVSGAEESGTQR
ncbi:hypothetical protein [Streptomyces sp. NPDC058579]|uniref:hypothetical protein n=1 Tax=Streptomyces sp. NPDC058579 TaxID=3346548 RepID=UPI00364C538F